MCRWLEQSGISYRENAPMREYTTFRAGGPADLLVSPSSAEQVRDVLEACRASDLPVTVLGNGSNTLVRDGGIRGVVLHLGPAFSQIRICKNVVTAQAGAKLGAVVNAALGAGLVGM